MEKTKLNLDELDPVAGGENGPATKAYFEYKDNLQKKYFPTAGSDKELNDYAFVTDARVNQDEKRILRELSELARKEKKQFK